MQQTKAMKILSIAMCLSIAMPVFAESAPVYDVDAMQQELDANSVEQSQELPLPPAPGQEANASPGSVPSLAPAPSAPAMAPSVSTNNSGASSATDQRVRRLEEQIKTLQSDGSAARVESLQQEVQTLRGQVDELTHQLQQAQSQQKTMYADLDKRVAMNNQPEPTPPNTASETVSDSDVKPVTKAKAATTAAKTPRVQAATKLASAEKSDTSSGSSVSQQPDVAEEQQIYQTAYNLIKAKKYNEAINALQGMLKKYPTGQFASNAHYWLGELYGLVGKNDQALKEFTTVVQSYSASPRVADAQLKIGLIYAAQVKWAEAKSAFKKVINHYPGSAPAKLAATQLKQIKDAGH
jgi:tol-pal system protein YbgF